MSESPRVNISKQDPASYKALTELIAQTDRAAADAGLDPLLVELVKLRASQLNHCAYCLRLHTRQALAKGESSDRLAVLPAWRESSYFSAQEQAALAYAESITQVGDTHVDDDDYAAAAQQLSPEQLSAVAWVTLVMNATNRVAVTSRYHVA